MGAVVYDNFTPYECCVHIAIADRRCVTRQNIRGNCHRNSCHR